LGIDATALTEIYLVYHVYCNYYVRESDPGVRVNVWLMGLVLSSAGFLAGAVNSVAGGGTLIAYPALLACGAPPIAANVTSLVGLIPGYVGGAVAYRSELAAQRKRLPILCAAAVTGGIVGAVILLFTPARGFQLAVPYLVLFSALLLFAQPWLCKWVRVDRPSDPGSNVRGNKLAVGSTLVGSIYGSYFSAGVGVLLLAALGISLNDEFQRINGLKNGLSLVIILAGASLYLFSSQVNWIYALILLPSSTLGGLFGGKLAKKVNGDTLRYSISLLGIALAGILFLK
jgi:uncharacterized membrane protein YfcA